MKYIELKVTPRGGVGLQFAMKKVFTQVHLALVESGGGKVGVSFPDYDGRKKGIGRTIRLFAKEDGALCSLSLPFWMRRLSDYVWMSGVQDVPESVMYERFSRAKGFSLNAYVKRRMKRHGEGREDATKVAMRAKENMRRIPFIMVHSASSNQQARIHIRRAPAKGPGDMRFNTYGLSSTSAVPIF